MTRAAGAAMAFLGALLGLLPFLPWYRVDLPDRRITFSGVEVAGELWSLPALALLIVAVGGTIAAAAPTPTRRLSRWLGAVSVVLGGLAVAWALKGALDIRAVAVPAALPEPPQAPLRAEPVAFLAAATSAAIACIGLLWLREGSRS